MQAKYRTRENRAHCWSRLRARRGVAKTAHGIIAVTNPQHSQPRDLNNFLRENIVTVLPHSKSPPTDFSRAAAKHWQPAKLTSVVTGRVTIALSPDYGTQFVLGIVQISGIQFGTPLWMGELDPPDWTVIGRR
jgi:hypothetical protein